MTTELTPCEQDFRRGYADGFGAAQRAADVLLRERGYTPAETLREADHFLLHELEDWYDEPLLRGEPPCFPGCQAARRAQRTERGDAPVTCRDYRRGYIGGWEAALDALTYLTAGRAFPHDQALERMDAHARERLGAWCAGDPRFVQPPPPLWEDT